MGNNQDEEEEEEEEEIINLRLGIEDASPRQKGALCPLPVRRDNIIIYKSGSSHVKAEILMVRRKLSTELRSLKS